MPAPAEAPVFFHGMQEKTGAEDAGGNGKCGNIFRAAEWLFKVVAVHQVQDEITGACVHQQFIETNGAEFCAVGDSNAANFVETIRRVLGCQRIN